MKTKSIIVIIIGLAITIFCLYYFRPALNVVDSDPVNVNPAGIRAARWPLFAGILTTFVGVVFLFISFDNERKAKLRK
ncbi:MAG TPA: hypothetical protein VHB54_11730 [Mucilaginibacter sp.]|nr:hypothetical protein [Bacteroidota bacterium]HVW14492.1 hypothetical protein [Mucilaginibacter sp.]